MSSSVEKRIGPTAWVNGEQIYCQESQRIRLRAEMVRRDETNSQWPEKADERLRRQVHWLMLHMQMIKSASQQKCWKGFPSTSR